MAVKTITIDMGAYNLLAGDKRENESFSRVIKRRFGKGATAGDLLNHLDDVCLSVSALNKVEHLISSREESLADSPRLS
jgi:predicted CopG family antitoxin